MSVSPQLRALGPFWRILAVVIEAAALTGCDLETGEVWNHPLVKTAILIEGDRAEGWHQDHAARVLTARGWNNADGIYDAAGIPEKHRRVIDLVLMRAGDPDKNRKGYFTLREIADLTGHPLRTVQEWAHDDMAKLKRLDWEDVA